MFIKFPVHLPIIYASILWLAPSYETLLIFFTILLLGETHFGATWPLLANRKSYDYYRDNRFIFYIGPILVIVLSIVGFFFIQSLFYLVFFLFNVYHVTRQSVGICKLYNKDIQEQEFQKISIYTINVFFVVVAFFTFMVPQLSQDIAYKLGLFSIATILAICTVQYLFFKNLGNILTTFSGLVIFLPVCFVTKPVHAILMGVTIHYSQYLFITMKVYFSRKNSLEILKKPKMSKLIKSPFFLTAIFYSVMMSIFSSFSSSNQAFLESFIIIPLIGQMLHFYLDGYIWKFNIEHNRNQTLKPLFRQFT